MSSLSLSAYGIVTDWSIWVAALIALAVYVHVQKAALRILPDFDINRERLLTYLDRLPINLDWLRRAAPSEAVVVEPVAPVVEFAEPDVDPYIDWQRDLLEAQLSSMERIGQSRERAAQSIESAEYMLSHILDECAAVMLTPEAAEQLQRHRAALAETPAIEDTDAPVASSVAALGGVGEQNSPLASLGGHRVAVAVAIGGCLGRLGGDAEALDGGQQDLPQQLRIAHALEAGHDVHLAVPAPARIGIDLEQLDLALGIGAEVEAGVVAAAQPLEQARGAVDHLLLLLVGAASPRDT